MRISGPSATALAAVATFLACTSPGPTAEELPVWGLVLERRVTPPDDDSDASLAQISSLAASASGTTYVMDAKPTAVKVYNSGGDLIRIIGREGAGPGEFLDRSTLHLHHDTLVVHDRGNSRIVLFDTTGRYLATAPAGAGPASGITSDGLLPVFAYLPDAPAPSPPGEGLIRYRLNGTVVDTIHFPVEPLPPMWTLVDASGDRGAVIPLTAGTILKAAPDGHLVVGNQDRPELFVLTDAYDTLATFRLRQLPAVPIPDQVRRERFDGMVNRAEWLRPIARIEDIPTRYPSWEDLSFDPAGNVWVSRRTADGLIWEGYRLDGTVLAIIDVPFPEATGLRLTWVGNRLHRASEDQDGLPLVEVWGISKE